MRLAVLKCYEVLDTPPEEAFDRVTRLVAKIIGAQVSLISLVDENRQFFKSTIGLPDPFSNSRETPLSHSLCQYVVKADQPFIVGNTVEHPVTSCSLAVSELHVKAYAGVPLRTKQGVVLGALCVMSAAPREWSDNDVHVLKEFAEVVMDELDFRLATKRLFEAEAARRERTKLESVGRLCAGIAHDFNNIVTMILADIDLARETKQAPPELLEHLANIENSSLRAAKLTGQLLRFGRSHPIQKKSLHLNALIVDALPLLRRMVREDIEISLEQAAHLPCIRADRDLLIQVLVNLIANANDAMPTGGTIVIATSRYQTNSHARALEHGGNLTRVSIAVNDTGIGITSDDLPRVFEPFFSTKEVDRGTGLGLSSAYGIAQQHDGWLEIDSDPGHGTTVRLGLPALHEEMSELRA